MKAAFVCRHVGKEIPDQFALEGSRVHGKLNITGKLCRYYQTHQSKRARNHTMGLAENHLPRSSPTTKVTTKPCSLAPHLVNPSEDKNSITALDSLVQHLIILSGFLQPTPDKPCDTSTYLLCLQINSFPP